MWDDPYKIKWVTKNELERKIEADRKGREFRSNLKLGILSIIFLSIALTLLIVKRYI